MDHSSLVQDVSIIDVATFSYAASTYWACFDILEMTESQAWLTMLCKHPSFQMGLTIPFACPASFGPHWAMAKEIEANISGKASQF